MIGVAYAARKANAAAINGHSAARSHRCARVTRRLLRLRGHRRPEDRVTEEDSDSALDAAEPDCPGSPGAASVPGYPRGPEGHLGANFARVEVTSIVCSVVGAAVSISAAVWLLVGFNPMSEKYSRVVGGGYSQSRPVGLQQLLRDQSRAAGLTALGGMLQLVGIILSLLR